MHLEIFQQYFLIQTDIVSDVWVNFSYNNSNSYLLGASAVNILVVITASILRHWHHVNDVAFVCLFADVDIIVLDVVAVVVN